MEGRNCYHLVRLVVDNALAADLPVGDEERPADTSRHALSLHLGGGRYAHAHAGPGSTAWARVEKRIVGGGQG